MQSLDKGRGEFSFNIPKRLFTALILACVVICFGLSACGRKVSTGTPPGFQTGQASWYGKKYHNRTTASGETFDMGKLTAAHRTLPFNTVVRVENLKNGRKVNVRINDRGPFVSGRIIDLSRKAAEKLDMIADGVVPVRIQILD
jgi:rare lipoprotein A